MATPRHLWLLGLSGSGKSTVGPRLAKILQLPWIDTDSEIARQAGQTIPEIFAKEGEEGFRKRESDFLEKVCHGPAAVVSCGGGIVVTEANRLRLAATGLRIYLQSDPAILAGRLRPSHGRPLISGQSPEDVLTRQLRERAPWYEESEIQIDVRGQNPDEVVAAIRQKLPAPWFR
jgi:shikimate kinase